MNEPMTVTFWGVRGSIPSPGPDTVKYGGNTPCVEVCAGGGHYIFDGGTGLRALGQHLLPKNPLVCHMFFTHTHWDHIQGFPFFAPAFSRLHAFTIHAAADEGGHSIKAILTRQMNSPHFPVPLIHMGAKLSFHEFLPGESIALGEVQMRTARLNHPGGSTGYRLEWRGRSVVYASDTEHFEDEPDPNVLGLAEGADLMIYDAMYTEDEYCAGKQGWGHSTWEAAVAVGNAAGVRNLALYHHEPNHSDEFLDEVQRKASAAFQGNLMIAREGETLSFDPVT
jgi:phosphoribosyl 1,2-cyclic phosphodiesterase